MFVMFISSMTKFDIRNYFEKIYNIKVKKVNTRIQLGKLVARHYVESAIL
jgi:ribosomal protein L23